MPRRSDRYALYVLTRQGLALCLKLAGCIEADVFVLRPVLEGEPDATLAAFASPSSGFTLVPFDSLRDAVCTAFPLYSCHLFITATGIAVRMIAPLIAHKASDPAVLVADQAGCFVISLLSGHLGGANDKAVAIAKLLGAQPVITTATDSEGLPAIDALAGRAGLHICSLAACKVVSSALLRGEPVFLYDPDDWLGLAKASDALDASGFTSVVKLEEAVQAAKANACVIVSEQVPSTGGSGLCWLHPKKLFAGVGMRRGVSKEAVLAAVESSFSQHDLSMHSLCALASVDIKADEQGLCAAADSLSVPVVFYTAAELANYPCTCPSAKVMDVLGIAGVCEGAALAAAQFFVPSGTGASAEKLFGKSVELLVPKQIHGFVTVAVARPFQEKPAS